MVIEGLSISASQARTNYVFSSNSCWGLGRIVGWLGEDIITVEFTNGKRSTLSYSHYHASNSVQLAFVTVSQRCQSLEYLQGRNVKYLVHFTHVDNIPNILKYGIQPRNQQNPKGIWSDNLRLDQNLEYSSFSISYPNYRMLYSKNSKGSQRNNKYVILLIDIAVLGTIPEANILFFQDNAANAHTLKSELYGIKGVKRMFEDKVLSKEGIILYRQEQNLSSEYTTNPQAEVQICSTISPRYIRSIVVMNQDVENWVQHIISDMSISVFTDDQWFWPNNPSLWKSYEQHRRT